MLNLHFRSLKVNSKTWICFFVTCLLACVAFTVTHFTLDRTEDRQTKTVCPYDLAVVVLPTAIGGGQCWRALLQVPGFASTFGSAGNGDGVDRVGVAITRAVVSAAPTVAWGPDKDRAATLPTLTEEENKRAKKMRIMRVSILFVIFCDLCDWGIAVCGTAAVSMSIGPYKKTARFEYIT